MIDLIGRDREMNTLRDFGTASVPGATLGLVWGRRRTGKSMMLERLVAETDGVHFQALRGSGSEALRELGAVLAKPSGAAAPLRLGSWDEAVSAILALGAQQPRVVVLDDFPYLLEHTPELEAVLQRQFAAANPTLANSKTRLILCGSSIGIMSRLLRGTDTLRTQAGLALRISPFDYRVSRELHGVTDLATAVLLFSMIGGVAAYARDMVNFDVPTGPEAFDRWIAQRVLAPSAPLVGEIDLLLGEDPALAKMRKITMYHATLSAVARGNRTWTSICNYVGGSGGTLTPVMNTLIASELVARLEDPVRSNRPTYNIADSLLRVHYAVIRRYQQRLARPTSDTAALWQELVSTVRTEVVGPCFEAMARHWATHWASAATLGGIPAHVGPTVISGRDGDELELDLVVAADDGGAEPDRRTIMSLGVAKVGQILSLTTLRRLERARAHFGARAAQAKLLLIGRVFDADLVQQASRRSDVEVVDLERLYYGS
jgi:AAA+ ATPase superfamily predicted ATPase